MTRTMTRRHLLETLSGGFGMLALAGLCAERASAKSPLAAKPPHFAPRAKRVIFLFMEGGPSQYETFEDNSDLAAAAAKGASLAPQYRFHRAGQSGLPVSEIFPHVARHADKLCVMNGLHTGSPAHAQATIMMHTGAINFVRPSVGAWVVYGLGCENRNLPGYVAINPTPIAGAQNYGSAFLPAYTQGTPYRSKTGALPNSSNKEMSAALQRRQLDLVQSLNEGLLKKSVAQPELEGVIESFEMAFRMQTAAPAVLDLKGEPESTRREYGLDDPETSEFGTQCLLARRLAEADVRFIEVCHATWDHHGKVKDRIKVTARQVDRPIAALLGDLERRGLLDDTIVLWGGEFGRTAEAQFGDGRNHNNKGFTMWASGGGFKRGFRLGATDPVTGACIDGKMHVHDLHATILHQLGLDHTRLTYHYSGREMRLTDVHGNVAREVLS